VLLRAPPGRRDSLPSPLRCFQWHPAEALLSTPTRLHWTVIEAQRPPGCRSSLGGMRPPGSTPPDVRSGSFHCNGRWAPVKPHHVGSSSLPGKDPAPAIEQALPLRQSWVIASRALAEYPPEYERAAEHTGRLGLNLAQCRNRLGSSASRAKVQHRVGGSRSRSPRASRALSLPRSDSAGSTASFK
jgi:hypothetical protein